MFRVVLLVATNETIEDGNYCRIGNELLRRGITVDICWMETLSMSDSQVVAKGYALKSPMTVGTPFPAFQSIRLEQSDLVWVLTLGMRHSFLDKVQLLQCLESQTKLINSLEALMHFKSKYFLASHADIFKYPQTWASNNPHDLFNVIEKHGGQWIAKPPAGSLGRDIFLINAKDSNTRVILESMTGIESDEYCLIQPYVEEIQRGEKRVLIAEGQVIGQYLRIAQKDHRTNIMQGASIEACSLTDEEAVYCEKIGKFLVSRGAHFVGLDLAYPYVIEFNVVNPGGITTIEEVTGEDVTHLIVDNIFPESIASP